MAMQQRSEETRESILTSASQLFARQGYEATGVAEICQQAGISKGAFYHHFPSKQTLFLVLLENWISRLEERFLTIQQHSKDVPSAIMDMVENVKQTVKETDTQLSLLHEFWTRANRDPEIWKIAVAPYRRFQQYFTGLIKEGIQEKSFKQIDPELAVNVLVSLALGLLLQRIFYPNSMDWGVEMSKSISLMLDGMIRREN